jgi:MFS family permease
VKAGAVNINKLLPKTANPAPLPPDRDPIWIVRALMMPMVMMVLQMLMFSVSLPLLRNEFGIGADTTAWLETAYALPLVIFMPLYGRLGDGLGKRRLFMVGIVTFLVGSAITPLATGLGLAMLGRAIQGMGAASVNPLCIAIISEWYPPVERGRALGTWNQAGPLAGVAGPLLGGVFVDIVGWRLPFGLAFVLGVAALLAVAYGIPAGERQFASPGYLRNFDWVGVILLGLGITGLIFFTSSRPITGVTALQDWRLLGVGLFFMISFVAWERRHPNPFVPLQAFKDRTFVLASVSSGLRMWTLGSIGFLNTLYLTDVRLLNATGVGACRSLLAGGLLVTMRFGGGLADRWGSSRPAIIGLSGQSLTLLGLALLPGSASLGWVLVLFSLHGLAAGLSLAGLHRAAMGNVPPSELGIASGVYGMIRFGGMVTGVALVGVMLQSGLEQFSTPLPAYQLGYALTAAAAALGVGISWLLGHV